MTAEHLRDGALDALEPLQQHLARVHAARVDVVVVDLQQHVPEHAHARQVELGQVHRLVDAEPRPHVGVHLTEVADHRARDGDRGADAGVRRQAETDREGRGRVFVLREGRPSRVAVEVGLADEGVRVVQALPERDRQCVSMRAEGVTYRTIAQELGMSLGGVAKAIARAAARLSRGIKE